MNGNSTPIAGEATYAIVNGLTNTSHESLIAVYMKHSGNLCELLSEALTRDHCPTLIINILTAMQKLLSLDQTYSDTIFATDSVKYNFMNFHAFDKIEELTKHRNMEVFNAARNLLDRY